MRPNAVEHNLEKQNISGGEGCAETCAYAGSQVPGFGLSQEAKEFFQAEMRGYKYQITSVTAIQ